MKKDKGSNQFRSKSQILYRKKIEFAEAQAKIFKSKVKGLETALDSLKELESQPEEEMELFKVETKHTRVSSNFSFKNTPKPDSSYIPFSDDEIENSINYNIKETIENFKENEKFFKEKINELENSLKEKEIENKALNRELDATLEKNLILNTQHSQLEYEDLQERLGDVQSFYYKDSATISNIDINKYAMDSEKDKEDSIDNSEANDAKKVAKKDAKKDPIFLSTNGSRVKLKKNTTEESLSKFKTPHLDELSIAVPKRSVKGIFASKSHFVEEQEKNQKTQLIKEKESLPDPFKTPNNQPAELEVSWFVRDSNEEEESCETVEGTLKKRQESQRIQFVTTKNDRPIKSSNLMRLSQIKQKEMKRHFEKVKFDLTNSSLGNERTRSVNFGDKMIFSKADSLSQNFGVSQVYKERLDSILAETGAKDQEHILKKIKELEDIVKGKKPNRGSLVGEGECCGSTACNVI